MESTDEHLVNVKDLSKLINSLDIDLIKKSKKPKKLPDVITYEEFNKVLTKTNKKEHRLAFKLGFLCGLRVSEVTNLQPSDVFRDRGLIKVVSGKGNKDRYVPIPKPLVKDLSGLPIKLKRITLQKAIERIGFVALNKKIHFHTLRHSCATYYLSRGMNIKDVQILLGHSRMDTTGIYLHVSPDQLKSKFDEIWQ